MRDIQNSMISMKRNCRQKLYMIEVKAKNKIK